MDESVQISSHSSESMGYKDKIAWQFDQWWERGSTLGISQEMWIETTTFKTALVWLG